MRSRKRWYVPDQCREKLRGIGKLPCIQRFVCLSDLRCDVHRFLRRGHNCREEHDGEAHCIFHFHPVYRILSPESIPMRLSPLAIAVLFPHFLIAADVYLSTKGSSLRFGNGLIELELDTASGFFRQIRNKATG